MVAKPSMMKNTMSKAVSESAPLAGWIRRMRPAAVARTDDRSDHQKPGAPRAPKVVIQPIRPLTRKIQPKMMVTAIVANIGSIMASAPRMSRMTPSTRKKVECSCSVVATAARSWFGSVGVCDDIMLSLQ